MAVGDKYHVLLNSVGYVLSQNKNGIRYYQKKRAPSFVNRSSTGDPSYRDSSFWQYLAQTNWRNGSKQLKFDDPGKFWKSSDVDTTILEELSLSKQFVSAGQMAAGIKVNSLEAWRSSTSWWNASYGYRQQLTITAPAATQLPTGYPVSTTIDTATLQTASKVRSDRKDWRIVYFNGSAWVDLFRDYVTTTNTVFALQAAITAGSSDGNYYVYYGYSSESTTKQPSADTEWNAVYGMYGTTPDANTLAVYHFRDGSGTTVTDDKGSYNLTSNMNWSTAGKFGRAGDFTGTGDKGINISDDFNLGSMTIEAWVKLNALGSDQIIVARYDGSDVRQWSLAIDGSNHVVFGVDTAGAHPLQVGGSSTLTTGIWYHLAGTCDGSGTIKVYVNGVVDGTTVGSGGTTSMIGPSVFVGRKDTVGTGDELNGYIAHIRISNSNRTSFPYVITGTVTVSSGGEIATQPPSTSFDLYGGGSDGKVYKWDGTTTWTEQFDCRRITWYETGNDANELIGDEGGTEKAKSQGFQLPYTQTIKAVQVYIKKNAGTPGNITVTIETDSTNKPSGTLADAAATGTITAFTTATYGWVTCTFATAFTLAATTTYHLVLKTAAATNDQNYAWAADASSPSFSSGAQSYSADGGTNWTADAAKDQYFRILGQETSVNCMLVTSIGGTQKLYIGSGNQTGQTNSDARIHSYDGSTWALTYVFAVSTSSMVNSMAEYTANSKAYIGVGPQARIYETADFVTFTLSKDINVPQNPGYIYALKEYNRVLHAGGGSPEFLPTQYYNGFLNIYDTTTWNILYPFDFTLIKSLEFYDAYLFMGTYHGHLYVYDTSTLSPLFNFKEQYNYKAQVYTMKYFDDKLYLGLYPQDSSNETNVGIWLFDRRGLSLAHTVSGVTGYRCFTVVNGLLMVGTGDDGYVYKLDPNNYTAQGWVQHSYFDANLPSIDKLYNSITIRYDPLASGQSIVVYYKFKESDAWTTLGTANTAGAITSTFSFASGTYSKKISVKIELNTTDTSASPKLTEVIMQYALYPVRKWMWTMRFKAKKSMVLLDGTTETLTATQIRTGLEDLLSTQQLYTFVDIDATSYSVLVNDIDQTSWVVNQDDVNEDEVVLTLLEA